MKVEDTQNALGNFRGVAQKGPLKRFSLRFREGMLVLLESLGFACPLVLASYCAPILSRLVHKKQVQTFQDDTQLFWAAETSHRPPQCGPTLRVCSSSGSAFETKAPEQ